MFINYKETFSIGYVYGTLEVSLFLFSEIRIMRC